MAEKCEVCGNEATASVSDVTELPAVNGYRNWEVRGTAHQFCDSHSRLSHEYVLSGEIQEAIVPGDAPVGTVFHPKCVGRWKDA